MKLKDKQNSRKNVHMPIEPNRQQRSMVQKNGIDRVSSPDALLDENDDALESDQVIEDHLQQIILNGQKEDQSEQKSESIPDQNIQNSKSNIQKEQEQKQKLLKYYLEDFYSYILRPIGQSLICHCFVFILVFILIKAFWVFQDISFRKQSEETYLKNLLNARNTIVEKDFQHSFSFLDSVTNIFQANVYSLVSKSQNQQNCSDFNQRYLCNSKNHYSEQLYKTIDINYDLVVLELIMSMAHINIKNAFFFTETQPGFVEINLTKIENQYQIQHDFSNQKSSTALCYQQVHLLTDYVKKIHENTSSEGFYSYLDSKSEDLATYQMFELYTSYQNETTSAQHEAQYSYNVYCLQIAVKYGETSRKGKVCINIASLRKLQNSVNIFYIKTNFPRIDIRNRAIVITSYTGDYMQNFYSIFQSFIQNEVQPQFPEYHLDKNSIIECLKFHESFHEMFAEDYFELQIFRCYPFNYLHTFVGKYIFAWSLQEAAKLSYHSSPLSLIKEDTFKFESFIISNRTYFYDVHEISSSGIQNIEKTLNMICCILLVILLSFETSKFIIKTQMIDSLFTLKRLSRLVISIDDVKKSETQFKKILKQLQEKHKAPKTQIFGVFIGYLEKFLWIKKLYYYNKRYSQHKETKTRLLFEGLNLFKYINDEAETSVSQKKKNSQILSEMRMSNSDSFKNSKKKTQIIERENNLLNQETIVMNYKKYPAVLIYIYQELVALELNKIENFQNVKVLSKRRDSNRKTNQMHILHEIDNDRQSQPKYHYEKEENDHSQDVSIYGQELPQISIMDHHVKQNKGVRFSNQIQLRGFNHDEKKSKFRQQILSNSSIGKKSSLKSVKSIESQFRKRLDQSERISKSQQDSVAASSSKKLKREATIKNILRGDESVHQDLKTMKFDQSLNIQDQKQNHNKYSGMESYLQQNPMELSIDHFYYTHKQILEQTIKAYERIAQHYEQLIEIKEQNLDKIMSNKTISPEEEEEKIKEIYSIQIKRLKICFKYLKLLLDESKGEEIDFEDRGINLNFDHLSFYESNYEIRQSLLDKSNLFKMKISICLGKAISYKHLEEICKSDDMEVSLESNYLYAQELSKVEPFLDFQVINICHNILTNFETSISFKRKCLELMIKTLARQKDEFIDQIDELELIKRYYNTTHKKFYFVADMSEAYDIFTPILTKVYELMGKMDLMHIYNLAMNENSQDMELVREIIKPQTSEAFLSLFEQLTLETQKSKQKNSSKLIHKRMVYEKDFNQILDQIQKDETQFSSFLVIILGGDQLSNLSSIISDDVDSSNNQRQLNQLLYSEINRKIEKNYYHILQIGTHLNNFMTKQGKLKKHIKNCQDLLQIDLIKKNLPEHFAQIEKFILG